MPNLVEQMGAPYFTEKFTRAYFLKDDKVYQVLDAQRPDRVRVLENGGKERVLAASDFTGFKVFEYPLLGYRRWDEHRYGYSYKKQTTNRGFRLENIITTWSSATRALIDLGVIPGKKASEEEKVGILLQPKFDELKDLPQLLAGKKSGLVLSSNVLIEPSTETADGWYSVFYKQAVVGNINSRGDVTWKNPAFAEVVNLAASNKGR